MGKIDTEKQNLAKAGIMRLNFPNFIQFGSKGPVDNMSDIWYYLNKNEHFLTRDNKYCDLSFYDTKIEISA